MRKRTTYRKEDFNYDIDWDTINELSFSEVCDWLDIDIIRNKIQCPSPTHEDNNPSCSIKDDRFCYCFSCGFSANPLKLIQTSLKLSRFEAVKYVNQHIPVLRKREHSAISDISISKWELYCLGLKNNPMYATTIAFEDPNSSLRHKFQETLPTEIALEIINDKFIENCATERMFLDAFIPYAKKIFFNALLDKCDIGTNPSNELWRYETQKAFAKAQSEYELRRQNYVSKHTGLNFQTLQGWFLSSKKDLVDKAIIEVGKNHYKTLEKKMNDIIYLLEQKEEDKLNDRQNTPTLA